MSIMCELFKSTGRTPCSPGSQRVKRCPLIFNPDSEDLLTGAVFGHLKLLWPELWLQPMLEIAYCQRDFNFLDYRQFKIEFWKKIPANALNSAWSEFDVCISIPPIMIIIECKYLAPLDEDQIGRYFDLIAFHYYQKHCEDTYLLLLTNDKTEPDILKKYRDTQHIRAKINELRPFVNYNNLCANLAQNLGWLSWQHIQNIIESIPADNLHYSVRAIIDDLKKYFVKKLGRANAQK